MTNETVTFGCGCMWERGPDRQPEFCLTHPPRETKRPELQPSKDLLSEQQIRFLLADAKFSIERGRALDSQLVSAWALEQLCETALAHRASNEPGARLPDSLDEIRARNQKAAERGNLSQAEFDTAWLLNYTAQPPGPERYSEKDVEAVVAASVAAVTTRTGRSISLLSQIAILAYDTSKAAEDRVREIQDLWEGSTSTKGEAR